MAALIKKRLVKFVKTLVIMNSQTQPTKHEESQEIDFLQPISTGCGLDMHARSIEACIMKKGQKAEIRRYGTTTRDLKELVGWILSQEVQGVCIESTGIYWYSMYHLLSEAGVKVTLVNPARVKQIPGKKTDTADCKWLCKLLMNGLVAGSFVPEGPQRELRELTRMQFKYVNLASQAEHRILKVLERANIKIRSVMSNITTKSGQAIVRALAEGQTDVNVLASLCKGRLRKKIEHMKEALEGLLTEHDRYQLRLLIKDQDHYASQIEEIEKSTSQIVADHFTETVQIVDSVYGIGTRTATGIVAEIGSSMEQFETADKLTSWSGLAPGNKESAGKKRKVKTVNGNRYLKPMLLQAAWTAVRAKNTYWSAQFHLLTKRLPPKKAIIAIARKMLKMIYSLLQKKIKYVELGAEAFWQQIKLRTRLKQQAAF